MIPDEIYWCIAPNGTAFCYGAKFVARSKRYPMARTKYGLTKGSQCEVEHWTTHVNHHVGDNTLKTHLQNALGFGWRVLSFYEVENVLTANA